MNDARPGARPLSIALLTYSTKPRGGVVHTVELGEALQDLGGNVMIYALNKDTGGFYRPPRCPFTLVDAAPAQGDIDAVVAQRIAEFITGLRRIRAEHDVWHAQDCISANALAALRAEGIIERFLRTVHHLDDFDSPYLRACQERSVREADRCLVVSASWQTVLRDQLGVQAELVPNGVNASYFSPVRDSRDDALRLRLPPKGAPVYITVGGVEPRKNAIGLLRAFIEVRKRLAGAQLVIVGGESLFDHAPYQRQFATIARQAGLWQHDGPAPSRPATGEPPPALVLAGVLPDELMPAFYRMGDAFVFPSVREGFGLALLEAMACGTPVVSSAMPPFTEFLKDGVNALLVDPRNPHDLADAMVRMAGTEVRHRLRSAAFETTTQFTWMRSAATADEIYRSFLKPCD